MNFYTILGQTSMREIYNNKLPKKCVLTFKNEMIWMLTMIIFNKFQDTNFIKLKRTNLIFMQY